MSGCAPSSLEDFQREGESRCKGIVELLEKVEQYEQLIPLEPTLKKKFESLVDLFIQAREFQERHPEDVPLEKNRSTQRISQQLQEELRRIYALEGARELIERSQQEALVKLDAFERTLARKKGHPHEAWKIGMQP